VPLSCRTDSGLLLKRLERLGHITEGQFDGVQFQKLEDRLYGVPFYFTVVAARNSRNCSRMIASFIMHCPDEEATPREDETVADG
jgi:hypothetical protein